MDGESDYWYACRSVSWKRFTDNLFDYRLEKDCRLDMDDEEWDGFHIEEFEIVAETSLSLVYA
jgi:hypothetical protein